MDRFTAIMMVKGELQGIQWNKITFVLINIVMVISIFVSNTQGNNDESPVKILPPAIDPEGQVHTTESCFNFPCNSKEVNVDCWLKPETVTLELSKCNSPKENIKILDIIYVRPMERGDICSSGIHCHGASCCCRKYNLNCSISILNSTAFNNIADPCSNKSDCNITFVSQEMERFHGFSKGCLQLSQAGCNSASRQDRKERCWARLIQVKYLCYETAIPGTTATATEILTTAATIVAENQSPTHIHFTLGTILAVSISLAVLIVILSLVVILLLCFRKKKSSAEKPPKQNNNIAMEFQAQPRDGSTLHLCLNESEPAKSSCQPFLNNTLPRDDNCGNARELPPGMIENNYYEGGPLPSKPRVDIPEIPTENCYDGMGATGGQPSSYPDNLKSDTVDKSKYAGDDTPSNYDSSTKMLHDNLENYMKEIFKFIDTPVLDLDNNNQNVDNIYETIPENHYNRRDKPPAHDGDNNTVIEPLMASCSDQTLPVSDEVRPKESDYTYTYGHFSSEGRQREPYSRK